MDRVSLSLSCGIAVVCVSSFGFTERRTPVVGKRERKPEREIFAPQNRSDWVTNPRRKDTRKHEKKILPGKNARSIDSYPDCTDRAKVGSRSRRCARHVRITENDFRSREERYARNLKSITVPFLSRDWNPDDPIFHGRSSALSGPTWTKLVVRKKKRVERRKKDSPRFRFESQDNGSFSPKTAPVTLFKKEGGIHCVETMLRAKHKITLEESKREKVRPKRTELMLEITGNE